MLTAPCPVAKSKWNGLATMLFNHRKKTCDPINVALRISAMPLASFAASGTPVFPIPPKSDIIPAIVPTNPISGAIPTIISNTTRPRSNRAISWLRRFGAWRKGP